MVDIKPLTGILELLRNAENLKHTLRTAWSSNGRQESTAEHTWRLCLMAMLLEKHLPEINHHKLLKICIIHDLAEALTGDISATLTEDYPDKSQQEEQAMKELLRPLNSDSQQEVLTLWREYENGSSPEAMLAKAFDKLETILQHTQGQNPKDFDYAFNLEYGKKYTDNNEVTRILRQFVDTQTTALVQ